MADLTTQYAGLTLRNPIIVGSSDLTDSVKSIRELEQHGAGAIVLGSIFEEEIALEYESVLEGLHAQGRNLIDYDYYDYKIRAQSLDLVTSLIKDAKQSVSIPVIASINCVYSHEWTLFAKEIEKAGADALEDSHQTEALYFKVIQKVLSEISIPISIKMSYYFSSLARMIQRLSETSIASVVLFNRFFSPDFDIDSLKVVTGHLLSSPEEFPISLRWVALMSGRVQCDIAASTGIHDSQAMIKQLLAGAQAVQIASTLYKNGPEYIQTMLQDLTDWMGAKGYAKIDDFRGKLSQAESTDPALYERVQFLKYCGGSE
jgi:dihydroorotate dehydrogenase (fumarate)